MESVEEEVAQETRHGGDALVGVGVQIPVGEAK